MLQWKFPVEIYWCIVGNTLYASTVILSWYDMLCDWCAVPRAPSSPFLPGLPVSPTGPRNPVSPVMIMG